MNFAAVALKNVGNAHSDGREGFKEIGDALKEFAERFIAKQVRSESRDFFVRIAGVSGITAILLDAYGSHSKLKNTKIIIDF